MMETQIDTRPWWKKWYIWIIIAGPLVVVVASFVTLYLAITHPDPVYDDYYNQGININKVIDAQNAAKVNAMAPAIQARNHAATGVVPTQAK